MIESVVQPGVKSQPDSRDKMDLEIVKKRVAGIPYLTLADAIEIESLILEHHLYDILELGFCHGVSTCYFAAILDKISKGHITTIDLESVRSEKPGIESLLSDLGLQKYVTVIHEPTSYTWRLMKMLEEQLGPRFDFCYIDGAHDWFTDGFAFLLIDKLLRPGGWVVFDDIDWTFATSPNLKNTPFVQKMPEDEKSTPQIRKVYELLVRTHPDYESFMIKNGRAFARKITTSSGIKPDVIRQEIVYQKEHVGLGALMYRIIKRFL
jgi:predicted O-methyltransferase YrrM